MIAIFLQILLFTGCYTQLAHVKNQQRALVPTQTIKDTTYDDLELNIRFYLYEKYHPGSCYGMPSKVNEKIMETTLENNPTLAKIIEERYDIYKDYQVYNILISFKKFRLKKIDEGYEFFFVDGDCCKITDYEGILYMDNDIIMKSEIISKKINKVPC